MTELHRKLFSATQRETANITPNKNTHQVIRTWLNNHIVTPLVDLHFGLSLTYL